MNIYWDSVNIYLFLMNLRDKSKGILTLDVIEDFGKASDENRKAINECEKTLNREFVTTYGYNEFLEAELAVQNDVL